MKDLVPLAKRPMEASNWVIDTYLWYSKWLYTNGTFRLWRLHPQCAILAQISLINTPKAFRHMYPFKLSLRTHTGQDIDHHLPLLMLWHASSVFTSSQYRFQTKNIFCISIDVINWGSFDFFNLESMWNKHLALWSVWHLSGCSEFTDCG